MSTNTWVIAFDPKAASELSCGARKLTGSVNAILFGGEDTAKQAIAAGADTVVIATPDALALDCADAIAASLSEHGAELVIVQSCVDGRLLAGMLASKLGTSALNVTELSLSDDGIAVKYLVYGGTAVCERKIKSPVAVLTVGAGVLDIADADIDANRTISTEIITGQAAPGLKLIETRAKQGEQVNLAAAKRVVGVGRGFAAESDLGLAQGLATAIGAEMACSRPITEGEDWMARERYIGVSGAVLKPDLYFAVGISGQVQHMVGVSQAKTIVAVNKDKNAPIFKQADIGIVGDLYTVLPAITAALG
jgi:electron transfer flavoprotein alpha subunit